ncbi:MAG TPA: tetratricopeptide repeat protein [Gemmatimonadaceae bacterium]
MIHALLTRTALAALLVCAAPVACAQEARTAAAALQESQAALRAGRYDEVISLSRPWVQRDSASASQVRVLAAALRATGRYAEAEDALARYAEAHPRDPSLWTALGEVQWARGRLAEAESSFRRAVDGRAPDSLTASLNLAILRFDRGEVDGAMQDFDRFIDIYNTRRGRLTASELAAVAVACRYLGRDNPQLFKDALLAFDQAIAADSQALEPRIRLAELFLEKYNAADALTTIREVLAVNPRHPWANVVMAKVRYFDEQNDVGQYVQRALEVDSVMPEARALAAQLLIDVERYDDAAAEARRGLVADSTAPAALIALAAAHYLRNDTTAFGDAMARYHARLPRSAEAEIALANIAARNRLYRQAAEFAEAGVKRDPKAARAYVLLGINTLRLGDIARGREMLDRAFTLDPYDVWAKNTLDLLDTFSEYEEVRTPRHLLVIEKKDAALIGLYASALVEQAYDSLARRYDYRPPTPVRVEFYRSHYDFSVRTVGLTGLGALGVAFGPVTALVSPAALPAGEFNWGSTLWHELAHVFTLGASDNRVPRWFSEGLSVYEERRARPSWGDDPSPLFFAAYATGRLPKVSRLNDGFMRPAFPEQVILSYYLASLVCEMIETEHGIDAIRAMLRGYRDGKNTEQVVREVLGADLDALDASFDRWMRQRYQRQLQSVAADAALGAVTGGRRGGRGGLTVRGEFAETLDRGRQLLSEGKTEEAIAELNKAKALFPQYAESDGPYALLAQAYQARGAEREAAEELAALTAINEQAYQENLTLATLLEELGDLSGAVAALDRALWISPFDPALHERLAVLAGRAGDHRIAIRERQAVLALDPTDRVEALYQLALAHQAAGDVAAARREVLRALELAPNFEKAQALLLRLRQPPSSDRDP